jgi:hypothetical protein
VSQARPVPPPAAALHSVEPKPVSPALLLRPNNSVLSLTSLLGDCTELEGLGSSSRPLSMAGLSSRCGSGASELIQLNSRAGNVDTPPGGPAAFETSDRLRRCLAPQVAQGDPELGLGSSHPNLDPDPSPAHPTLTRTNACIPYPNTNQCLHMPYPNTSQCLWRRTDGAQLLLAVRQLLELINELIRHTQWCHTRWRNTQWRNTQWRNTRWRVRAASDAPP